LPGEKFLRRFLLHVLPKGFMRIRRYGYLANRVRVKQSDKTRKYFKAAKVIAIQPVKSGHPLTTQVGTTSPDTLNA